MSYSGYLLTDASRAKLIEAFPPMYDDVIAHHITWKFPSDEMPPESFKAYINGYGIDEKVEAVSVVLQNSILCPNSTPFHITLSVNRDAGGKPAMSKLLEYNFYAVEFENTIVLEIVPQIFK